LKISVSVSVSVSLPPDQVAGVSFGWLNIDIVIVLSGYSYENVENKTRTGAFWFRNLNLRFC
jgi:hypothetical protein